VAKDVFPQNVIAALLDSLALDQINRASEQTFQLILHGGEFSQAGFGVRGELDEKVDVACYAKVLADRRAEQGQCSDVMLLTERRQA
jgi:hypothetical protein